MTDPSPFMVKTKAAVLKEVKPLKVSYKTWLLDIKKRVKEINWGKYQNGYSWAMGPDAILGHLSALDIPPVAKIRLGETLLNEIFLFLVSFGRFRYAGVAHTLKCPPFYKRVGLVHIEKWIKEDKEIPDSRPYGVMVQHTSYIAMLEPIEFTPRGLEGPWPKQLAPTAPTPNGLADITEWSGLPVKSGPFPWKDFRKKVPKWAPFNILGATAPLKPVHSR